MNLREAIRTLAQSGDEIYCKICTVDAVDTLARTVDCTPIDEGAPVLGVNLQANQDSDTGLVIFPAVGSYIVVAFLNQAAGVAILFDEITKVVLKTEKVFFEVGQSGVHVDVNGTTLDFDGKNTVFNGGSETTANATELQKQLNKMSGRIDAIIQAIDKAGTTPNDGGSTFKTALVTALSPYLADKESFSKMINDKIKHG